VSADQPPGDSVAGPRERALGRTPSSPLRRNRDFQLFWIGSAVSVLGSRVSSIGYPLLVLGLTGSPAAAGYVGFAATLPYLLFQLPFGALVDRWDRRKAMIAADVGRGLVLAAVAASIWLGGASIPWLLAAAFVEGALTVLSAAAEPAALRHLVHPDQYREALAQQEARDRAALLVGQPLGGALFSLGRLVPFLADALSYLASLTALILIRRPMQLPREPETRGSLRSEVLLGLRWLWRHPFFRTTSLLIAASNLLFQGLILVLIVLAGEQGASPFLIGVVLAGSGLGGVLGAVSAPWLSRRLSTKAVILGAHWAWALLLPLFVVLTDPLLYALVFALVGFVGPIWNVCVVSERTASTPEELQARVIAASKLATYGALPLGSLLAGLLLEHASAREAAAVLSISMFVLAVLATSSSAIRHHSP